MKLLTVAALLFSSLVFVPDILVKPCERDGCKKKEHTPQYSPPINNCGQYVTEAAATGQDGTCECKDDADTPEEVEVCKVKDASCAWSRTYTITPPAGGNHKVCQWTNYPNTPEQYNDFGWGNAAPITVSVAGCGDVDEERAYIMVKPTQGSTACQPNMFTICTMTFKLECTACNASCTPVGDG
jgi:hypothetical protein